MSDMHQVLMNAAYDRWQKHDDWSYEHMLAHCSAHERMAVLLGNFNYQIGNGGWSQWVDNGYATSAGEVATCLELIGTEAAKTALEFLRRLEPHLGDAKVSKGFVGDGDYWAYEEEEDGDGRFGHEGYEVAESMCSPYYEISGQLMADINEYFEKEQAAC